MTQSGERSQHLFVVRIWFESGETGRGPWRGLVEHVSSGQRLYFTSFSDLNDFIVFRSSAALAEPQAEIQPASVSDGGQHEGANGIDGQQCDHRDHAAGESDRGTGQTATDGPTGPGD